MLLLAACIVVRSRFPSPRCESEAARMYAAPRGLVAPSLVVCKALNAPKCPRLASLALFVCRGLAAHVPRFPYAPTMPA